MVSCGGGCDACSGCGPCPGRGALELTQPEIDFLRGLGQIPFQPVCREAGSEIPIYPGGSEQTGRVLRLLERKALISLDYDRPLAGCNDPAYLSRPVRGSIALTARGQQVLDLLDYQGVQ